MAYSLQWGIVSTGRIAEALATAVNSSSKGKLLAVASRDLAKAQTFAGKFNIPRAYGDYDQMLADKDVQAVYVATPHPLHARWAIAAARAGKHVLCEKPLTVNHAQAMAVFEAAHEHNVLAMEAFMYRCHPQTARLVELVKSGAIGQVRMIYSCFGFHAGSNPEGRLFKNDLAGGGILDVGCYAMSMARLIAGAALGRDFADPIDVKAVGHLGQTGVDEWTAGLLLFEQNIVAQIATAVAVMPDNMVRIFGSEGRIIVPNPWLADRQKATIGRIELWPKGAKEPQIIDVPAAATSFTLETDLFADAVARGLRAVPSPAMSPVDTLGNMRALDRWREAIGLTYEMEKIEQCPAPVHGGSLRRRDPHHMKYGRIPGLDKDISRLVMGVDNQRAMPHAAVMFDDFFERGGNAFDSAWAYSGGICERVLGQWVKSRGLREQVVILDKGAHTPHCDPASLTSQLLESLERLQMDYVDVYMMHRDNPDIPVSEFIDVLNQHVKAGRIRIFGGSNWSLDRVDEANAYAKAKGLQGFAAISNNFSLAHMVQPVWRGCIHCSDAASRQWLTQRQMPLMPWSSQARGFFTPRADLPAEQQPDKSLVRSWYSPQNFERRRRAGELAAQLGVSTLNVALAYVLCQPFPTFPLIGPRTLEETRTSLPGLDIDLTAEKLQWLAADD